MMAVKIQDYGAIRSCIFCSVEKIHNWLCFWIDKNIQGRGKIYFGKINFFITKL